MEIGLFTFGIWNCNFRHFVFCSQTTWPGYRPDSLKTCAGLNFSGNARELSSLTFLTAGTQFPLKWTAQRERRVPTGFQEFDKNFCNLHKTEHTVDTPIAVEWPDGQTCINISNSQSTISWLHNCTLKTTFWPLARDLASEEKISLWVGMYWKICKSPQVQNMIGDWLARSNVEHN